MDDLYGLIDKYKSTILFPYSPAHIQDLLKGSENPENLDLIRKDLDFLDSISQQNCLQFEHKNNRVEPFIGSSHILFDSYFETKAHDYLNPDNIVKMFEETPFPMMGKIMKTMWQMKPVEIDFDKMDEEPESRELLSKYFKRTRIQKNLYNFMLDISEFYHDMNNNPAIYKGLTDLFRKQTGIDPKVISNLQQPIEQLNKILSNSKIGVDFERISTIEAEKPNEFINSSFVKYSIEYSSLDMTGYHPDSLNKKNLFSNLTNDSHHSFYAGHCDYLVSFDDKMLYKSKVLYDKYKISTKALFPCDFLKEITSNFEEHYCSHHLFDAIDKTILECLPTEIKEHDFKDSIVLLFHPAVLILGYFNVLYLIQDKNKRTTIILRHISRNFSNFTFYTEIEFIVNKLVEVFGLDSGGLGSFKIEESQAFSDEEWTGRIWVTENYLFELLSDRVRTGVQLVIEQITEDFLNTLTTMH
jgi:hypothetical protein